MIAKKILVIDDEKGIRDLLQFLLEPRGFQVFTASNGMEGLEMVKKNIFDVIFLDVHMPVMNGLETLKLIRQIRPEQAVIISSSSSDPRFNFEEDAKKLGVFAFFYKPFYIDEIFKALEELFKKGEINGSKSKNSDY